MSTQPQFGEFCWNELVTGDAHKAKDFYCKLFGWTTKDHRLPNMTYTMFEQGDKTIGGMFEIETQAQIMVPPHWMSYILVENLDDMVAKAQSLGAVIKMPPTKAGDFGRFSLIADPTGAHVSLWEVAKK